MWMRVYEIKGQLILFHRADFSSMSVSAFRGWSSKSEFFLLRLCED